MRIYIRLLLTLVLADFVSASLVIRVNSEKGNDSTSCWEPNATMPCKSLRHALGALRDAKSCNETVFTVLIEDQVYSLEERVNITQTNPTKSVNLTSKNDRSVLNCTHPSAGIDIGTRDENDANSFRTRNIFFHSLEFKNCGPDLAAAVLIWNSVDIQFTKCVFSNNKQAGINAFDSGVNIDHCHFVNNTSNCISSSENYTAGVTAAGGGAGFLFYSAKNLSLIIKHSIFELNAAAVKNDSRHFVAPSYNVSQVITSGGGILVIFKGKTKGCQVVIKNTMFSRNNATFGGGVYLEQSNKAERNKYTVMDSTFTGNYAGQTGGGLIFSQWNSASAITIFFKNCTIGENSSQRGAGMNVFLMNFDTKPNASMIRFDAVKFSNNTGRASTAIRFTTALPYGNIVDVTPEFINCTFKDHSMSTYAHTSPFTSQRVNLKFVGINVFQHNYGGGAAAFQDCVVYVQDTLVFYNNSGSFGGALFIQSSQIKLLQGSELMFKGNKASGFGGAIFVLEHLMDEFVHVNNPDCFLAYHEPHLPPSEWKTTVSFIENSCGLKGAAIYISSLQRCVWNEKAPHYDPLKALRWSSKFVYQNNFLSWNNDKKAVNSSKYDIATDTQTFSSTVNSTLKLMPGELSLLNLEALDELGQDVMTTLLAFEVDPVNSTSRILLENNMYVTFPNETIRFSFQVSEATYNETSNSKTGKANKHIQFEDPFSTLKNGYLFDLEIQKCRPGFVFSGERKRCVCDTKRDAIERCENGSTVYLKDGYWAGVSARDGSLVTYFCPFNYCKCNRSRRLPGCLFDPDNSDRQCAKNREGRLCGNCTTNTSVGLRRSECIKCENSGWILAVVIPIVVGVCVLIIWLNPGVSSELRGPLFFFQVLPFIFNPASELGGYVFLVADIFNFGGPFIYLFRTCILQGINGLHSIAFGYLLPLLVLLVFLVAYLLSVNYCLRFTFRQHSMLRSFWLLLLFVYNNLVETSFLILFCPKVGDKHYFFYDGTMECFHGEHLPIGIIAIIVLVLMVIPPLIVVVLLTNGFWRVDPQYVSTLTNSLRPKFRWWWSVDLGRRVVVVAVFALVPDLQLKKILLIAVCIVILAIHSNCQPYLTSRANLTESLYLLVLCMLSVIQVVPNVMAHEDKIAGVYISVALLGVMSIHTIVIFFHKAVRFFRGRFECSAGEEDMDGQEHARGRYRELEDTRTDDSLDTEIERRRSILDTIFNEPVRQEHHE